MSDEPIKRGLASRTFRGKAAGRKIKGDGITPFASAPNQDGNNLLPPDEKTTTTDDTAAPVTAGKGTAATDKGKLSEYFKTFGKDPDKTAVTRRQARDYRKEGYDVDVKKRGGLFLKIQGYRPFYGEEGTANQTSTPEVKTESGIGKTTPQLSFTNPFSKYYNPSTDQLQKQASANGALNTTPITTAKKPGAGGAGGGKKKGGGIMGKTANTGVYYGPPLVQRPEENPNNASAKNVIKPPSVYNVPLPKSTNQQYNVTKETPGTKAFKEEYVRRFQSLIPPDVNDFRRGLNTYEAIREFEKQSKAFNAGNVYNSTPILKHSPITGFNPKKPDYTGTNIPKEKKKPAYSTKNQTVLNKFISLNPSFSEKEAIDSLKANGLWE